MQELLGRLQKLDPQAGAELRIVAHYDALVTGRVGLDALLRAAVTLSGSTAGFRDHDRTITIDPQGRRHDHGVGPTAAMPRRAVRGGGEVWLARSGPVSPSEEMVLERLALAVGISERRRVGSVDRDPLLVLIDPSADETERAAAITALRLSDRWLVRVLALAVDEPVPADHRTVLVGVGEHRLRAVLDVDHEPWGAGRRVGLGSPGKPDDLPRSWRTAVAPIGWRAACCRWSTPSSSVSW